MNNVILKSINLQPFKGVRANLNFDGDTEIAGQNGTGKTTIADAYFWLLTGKSYAGLNDSGAKSFSVLPIGEDSNTAEVSAEFEINGDKITLTRRIETKGESKSKKTSFYFDENEVNKTTFEEFVKEKFGVSDLRLFCIPGDFLARDWKEQRQTLLNSIPKMEDYNPTMEDKAVYAEIKKLGFDIWEKGKKKAIKEAKEIISAIPGKIQAINSVRPVERDYDKINAELEELRKADEANATAEMPKAWKDAIQAKEAIIKDFATARQNAFQKVTAAKNKVAELKMQQQTAVNQDKNLRAVLQQNKNSFENSIQLLETEIQRMRETYVLQAQQQRTPGATGCVKCPICAELTCDNPILLANLEETEKAAAAEFQRRKKAALDEIQKNAESKKAAAADFKTKLEKINSDLAVEFKTPLQAEIQTAEEEVKKAEAAIPAEPDTKELDAQISEIQKAGNATDNATKERRTRINELTAQLAEKATAEKCNAQIAEIEKQGEETQKILGNLELDLTIGQAIKREQMKGLESVINGHFNGGIEFKLFEEQVNGEFADTCQLLIDSVPAGRGVNKAAEINAALQIIEFLQDGAGVNLPVFVDNAESVNDLRKIETQTIALRVTEDDELTIKSWKI